VVVVVMEFQRRGREEEEGEREGDCVCVRRKSEVDGRVDATSSFLFRLD